MGNSKIWYRYILSIVFASMLLAVPYVFRQFLPVPSEKIILVAMCGLLLLPFMVKKQFNFPQMAFMLCAIIQIACWLLYAVIHNDNSYITRIFYVFFTFLMIAALSNFGKVEDFVRRNNILLCAQAVMGLLAFALVFVGLLPYIFTFANPDGRTAFCFGLTCTNAVFGNIIRPAGFFDEPGALAAWGMYALVLNQIFIKNKKVEIALIFGLLSTLSIAYYIQLLLYILFFKIRFNRQTLLLSVAVISVASYVYTLGPDNDIYKLTFGRFETDRYGNLETNRDDLMYKAEKLYQKSPVWGNGAENIEKGEYIADNPYESLATDGIVGTIIIYLPLIVIILKNINRKEIIFGVIIIAVGYLQRPFHLNVLNYIMLFSFLYLGTTKEKLPTNINQSKIYGKAIGNSNHSVL